MYDLASWGRFQHACTVICISCKCIEYSEVCENMERNVSIWRLVHAPLRLSLFVVVMRVASRTALNVTGHQEYDHGVGMTVYASSARFTCA